MPLSQLALTSISAFWGASINPERVQVQGHESDDVARPAGTPRDCCCNMRIPLDGAVNPV